MQGVWVGEWVVSLTARLCSPHPPQGWSRGPVLLTPTVFSGSLRPGEEGERRPPQWRAGDVGRKRGGGGGGILNSGLAGCEARSSLAGMGS